jgi:hypothetical protein
MYQTETRQDSKPMTAFPVHDEAHDAFMTLPPYSGTREGMDSPIGEVVQTTAFGPLRDEMLSREEKHLDQT